MMIDRELLERAAKAVGIEIQRCRLEDPMWRDMLLVERLHGNGVGWNPLTEDGDALRLAVNLGLDLLRTEADIEAIAGLPPHLKIDAHTVSAPFAIEKLGADPLAATRRAIVRAAAQIGKSMENQEQ